MKAYFLFLLGLFLTLMSCKSEPSLQEYFVDRAENRNFIAFELPSKLLNIDTKKLSSEQQTALTSFEKLDILAFQCNDKNNEGYQIEKLKVKTILKSNQFENLIKYGNTDNEVAIYCVGNTDKINEFDVFLNKKNNGFAIIRILGNNMNPNNIMVLMSILQNANLDISALKPLENLLKNPKN